MTDGYEVTRSALESASRRLAAASYHWDAANGRLGGARLAADDLGVIGELGKIVPSYNSAVDEVWRQVNSGARALAEAAAALLTVRDHYQRAEDLAKPKIIRP